LERVHHRATRMILGLAKLDYEARLYKMNFPSLTYRRARGDAIETYKYLHGLYTVDSSHMLHFTQQTEFLPGDTVSNYKKKDCRTQLQMNYFGLRTVNSSNCQKKLLSLPLSSASRDSMTGTTLIYVSKIDTSSRSINRPHCLLGIEYDDDDDVRRQHRCSFYLHPNHMNIRYNTKSIVFHDLL